LGWGGFWFWDPVENASFMPWLLAAALLHSAIVVEKRESLKSWTILLAILAFGFSLIGTFIVRSGVLTSVHAFANDPERGVFILIILAIFIGGALTLFAARASAMQARGAFSMVSRETALVLNNILLAVSALVVFVGTIWPLLAEMMFDRKLSVGPPFFNLAFTPFMIALGIAMPIGAMIPWKRGVVMRPVKRLLPVFGLALAAAGLIWALQTGKSLQGPIGLFLGAWMVGGAITDLLSRLGKDRDYSRLLRLPRSDWGKSVAHSGLGVTMFAVAGLMVWQQEDIRIVAPGETWSVGAYTFTLQDVSNVNGPNYRAVRGDVALEHKGRFITKMHPEKRFYPVANMPTTEAAIDYRFLRDVYLVLGDQQENGAWTLRTYIKPLTNWIWAGALLMALGGGLSLTDRRFRVAAGARRKTPVSTVNAPAE
jgi:cytochrome c-type biogenesis protein CcmF